MIIQYKNYTITRAVNSWPYANYEFVHDDYDGAPDAYDFRCGTASSAEECKELIDDMEDMGDLIEDLMRGMQ